MDSESSSDRSPQNCSMASSLCFSPLDNQGALARGGMAEPKQRTGTFRMQDLDLIESL